MAAQVETRRIRTRAEFDHRQALRGARQLAQAYGRLGGAGRELDDSFQQTNRQARTSAQGLGRLQTTVMQLAGAYLTVEGAQRAFNAAQQGGRSLELADAFEEQVDRTGQAADEMLDRLDRAAGGTVTDFELMKQSSAAMSLGVTSDIDQMAALMEVARFKGRKFALDTTDAFESITTGIGRMSPRWLDNLGIVIDSDTEYARYADTVGKTAGELSDMEKRQALLNAVLREGQAEIAAAGGLTESVGDKYRQVTTDVTNAKNAWLEWLAVVATQPVSGAGNMFETAEAAAETAKQITAMESALNAAFDTEAAQSRNVALRSLDKASARVALYSGNLEILRQIIRESGGSVEAFDAALQQESETLNLTSRETDDAVQTAGEYASELERLRRMSLNAASGQGVLTDSIGQMVSTATGAITQLSGLSGAIAGAKQARAAVDPNFAVQLAGQQLVSAQRQVAAAGRSGDPRKIAQAAQTLFEAQENLNSATERYGSIVNETTRSAVSGLTDQERAVGRLEDAWQSAVSNIRSTAKSQLDLSGGAVTQADTLMTDAGLYQNKPGEAARQLKDIMNRGFESPHVGDFGELAGIGDEELLKGRAAQIYQQFQKGLRPDLIDVGALTEQTAQALTGQQNLDKVYDQVTQNLLDRGFGESEVQKVLGKQLGTTDFISPLVETNKKALEQQEQQFQTMGDQAADVIVTAAEKRFGKGKLLDALIKVFASEISDIMTQGGEE